ncbi:phosphoribosylanthranilate isomerase [Rhodococcus triatomae]|uniref:phosphoribosylanthranilate isomerase n=1 Tax=Rhodococcus triatomae TaxID=300028 RepID=UPI00093514DF|nr:phosphoribosylanthranilate isomerase [Rhodococcus triatomae]QNG20336.1 phosphoribosylanthranilate isomerase [Rhodococcus triatomae]QNG23748.1 phosphoribosylanthranilate isomerase [Rhodococcus triatomae]
MTFIKVCGLRDDMSVDTAVRLGVDAVGFVFAASVRQISPDDAAPLVARAATGTVPVGVFKGNPIEEILAVAARTGLRTVQVHDLVDAQQVARLHAAGLHVVRAIVAGDTSGDLGADRLLVDGAVAGAGRTWDWSSTTAPDGGWILAGGLDPDNVADALAATGAWGVDVSSGVESERGVKDPALIEKFVAAVRAVRAD